MPTPERVGRLRTVAAQRQGGIVVFQDIHDPHNAEAALRSLDGFGFQYAWFIFEQEQPFDPRRVGKSSSASANKWLEYKVFYSTATALRALRELGYEVVATVPTPDAEPLFEAKFLRREIALLFGNEHRGLTEEAIAAADRRIVIPMAGMVRSLNLSVTVAICLYEVTRQRRAAGMEQYLLPEAERERIFRRWLQREEG